MLHLLSQPPLQQALIERIADGDDVVLQQAMVWSAFTGHADNSKLLQLLARQCRVFVMQEMLTVNGIENSQILAGVDIIDYAFLVDLTVKNPVVHSWC